MNKRGQVSIFIIVGVLLVSGILTFYFFRESIFPNENLTEKTGVEGYTQGCLEGVSEQAVLLVGGQGGYYSNLPEGEILYSFPYLVPYYIDNHKGFIPEKTIIEEEMGNYVDDVIIDCLGYFSDFTEQGYNITLGDISTTVKISDGYIDVNSNIPLTVTKGDSATRYEKFSTRAKPVRIPELLELSNEIAKEQTKDPRTVCITCLSDLADKYKIKINAYETSNRNEFVYVITDPLSNFTTSTDSEGKSIGIPYNWSFGARYNFPDCTTTGECFKALS